MSATIEISMIVKNGGATLARCLKSVTAFADRILIGDTGSTDDSIAIARSFGAEVISIPWENDFAQARNHVLAQRKCDWILVLDADEMLDGNAAAQIRQAIATPDVTAFHNWRWNYMLDTSTRLGFQSARPNPVLLAESKEYPAYVPLPTTRLFRSHPGILYEGCVHETVTRRIAALGLATQFAPFVVHHFGHAEDSELDRQTKNDLYQLLGIKKLREHADDPQALIEMGLAELENARRPAIALEHFNRACAISPDSGVAWLFAAICLVRLTRIGEAFERLNRAAQLGMQNALFFQTVGDAYFHGGRYAEACQAYGHLEKLGEALPLSEAKRGAAEVHLGAKVNGIARMKQAVADAPAFVELYDILMSGALLAGDLPLAQHTLQARSALGKTTAFHSQVAAVIDAQARQTQSSIAVS